jgi:acetyl esterase/lipase
MSILNSIAKLYVRLAFRDDGEFDPLKTQRELNVPGPPRSIVGRCAPLDHPNVRAFWIDKDHSGKGVLVYLHGGAFYFGPVKEHWDYLARICKQTGMAGLMVDYGIAPQHPFPTGLNEIVDLVSTLDLGPRWYFLGDSSGAAMAVSATLELAKNGAVLPIGLILMSPWLDLNLNNPEIELNERDDPMMSVKRLSNAARCYAGFDADLSDPRLSPMFGDLSLLPRVLIQMGTADLLLADCRLFHQKCIDAGVSVTYEEFPGAFHDFMMVNFLPEAKKALRSQTKFLLPVE